MLFFKNQATAVCQTKYKKQKNVVGKSWRSRDDESSTGTCAWWTGHNLMAWTGTRSRFTLLVITWWRRCCFCLYCSHGQTDRHTNASHVFFFNEAFDWEEEEEEPFSFSRFIFYSYFLFEFQRAPCERFTSFFCFVCFFPPALGDSFKFCPFLNIRKWLGTVEKVGVVHTLL